VFVIVESQVNQNLNYLQNITNSSVAVSKDVNPHQGGKLETNSIVIYFLFSFFAFSIFLIFLAFSILKQLGEVR